MKPCNTMALRGISFTPDSDLFRQELSNMINLRHPLMQLAQKIDWLFCQTKSGGLYTAGVGHPIHLMVGLQLLKHTCNLSMKKWSPPEWRTPTSSTCASRCPAPHRASTCCAYSPTSKCRPACLGRSIAIRRVCATQFKPLTTLLN